ncbi:galactosyl transferase GMA12/MNN10 domain protein [Paraburkholderia denitrificans]|uniref:Galactosyl transferase GMA12/MNN10 domain protein n=1 Tax=Paraburkholderia denitrificans TaxID=694025 RepID=A0ABW0J2V7_9BURK
MIVLSHFRHRAAPSLANHRHYARVRGYRHEIIDASEMPQALPLRALYRYETLLNTLRRADRNELILLLSEDAAIIEPIALEQFMADRDVLLVRASTHALPQIDVQIWRNTNAVRETVLQIVKRCRIDFTDRLPSEAAVFAGFESEHYMTLFNGMCPVMPTGYNYDPLWSRVPTFAISIDDAPHSPERKGTTPRFRDALIAHINHTRAAGLPMFSFPHYAADSSNETADRSAYNPGKALAVVTLYTPNIESYARIAEGNFRRYCETQGYTFYVHRDIPREIGLNASGNWFKPWLLHGYLQHHEWVIWLDADVLIADQQQKLEPLLEGRDYLLAHDVGQWPFNSGVMGFRRTARNDAMLQELMASISALPDKSRVYASDGDQLQFINAMRESGALQDEAISDMVCFNTPWLFRRPDSFIVHYYGMWQSMRTLMMAHDNALLA